MINGIFNEIKKIECVVHNPVGYLFGRTVCVVNLIFPAIIGMIAVAAIIFFVFDRFKARNKPELENTKANATSPNKLITPIQKKSQESDHASDNQNQIILENNIKHTTTEEIIRKEKDISANTTTKILEIRKEFPKIDLKEDSRKDVPVILKETTIETSEPIINGRLSNDLCNSLAPNEMHLNKFIQNSNNEIPPPSDLPPKLNECDTLPTLNESGYPIQSDDLPPPSDLPPKLDKCDSQPILNESDLTIQSDNLPPPSDSPPILNEGDLPIQGGDLPPPSDSPPEFINVETQISNENSPSNDHLKPKSRNQKISKPKAHSENSSLKKRILSFKKKIEIDKSESIEIENEIDPEMDPKEKRIKTLSEAKKAYHNCKKIYDFYSNENKTTLWSSITHISHEAKVILKKITRSEDVEEEESSSLITETISQLKEGVDNLESLKQRLKNDDILSFSEELSNESRLNGLIKTIELKIENLKNLDSVSASSIDKIEEVNLLIDDLKPEKTATPVKIIESKVEFWNEEIEQRDNFFKELISAEQNLAIDLKYSLSGQEGIQAKFQDNLDFCCKYETICENSQKMALELAKLNNENSDAEKMTRVITILQSSEFKDYIGSIKEYLPLAEDDSILKRGIDSRSLTLPTTRLALYPLLIEQAIKLTPSDSQEFADLTLELKKLKEALIFLNS